MNPPLVATVWDTAESPIRPARAIARPTLRFWHHIATLCAIAAGVLSALLALATGSAWPTAGFQGLIALALASGVLLPMAHLVARTQHADPGDES